MIDQLAVVDQWEPILGNMRMLPDILAVVFLTSLTVTIHAAGLTVVVERELKSTTPPDLRFWPVTWLFLRVTWWLMLLHLAEIVVWALFYWWQKCLPDVASSLYFSGVTYATIGYGDLVLPEGWRLLGPMEGLTGILMCGLSTGLFVAVMAKIFRSKYGVETN